MTNSILDYGYSRTDQQANEESRSHKANYSSKHQQEPKLKGSRYVNPTAELASPRTTRLVTESQILKILMNE